MFSLKPIILLLLCFCGITAKSQTGQAVSDSLARMKEIDAYVRQHIRDNSLTQKIVEVGGDCEISKADTTYATKKNVFLTGYYHGQDLIRINITCSDRVDIMNEPGEYFSDDYFFKDGALIYATHSCAANSSGSCGFHSSGYSLYFSADKIIGYSEEMSHGFYASCLCTLPAMNVILEHYSPAAINSYLKCLR